MSRQPLQQHAGGPTSRDVLTPNLTQKMLKYHSLPRHKLAAHTESGLAAAGILTSALGRRDGAHITLTGTLMLSAHARSLALEFLASDPTAPLGLAEGAPGHAGGHTGHAGVPGLAGALTTHARRPPGPVAPPPPRPPTPAYPSDPPPA